MQNHICIPCTGTQIYTHPWQVGGRGRGRHACVGTGGLAGGGKTHTHRARGDVDAVHLSQGSVALRLETIDKSVCVCLCLFWCAFVCVCLVSVLCKAPKYWISE